MLDRVGLHLTSCSQERRFFRTIRSDVKRNLTKNLRAQDAERYRTKLLSWYDTEHRDLPWRRTRDPYRIWVSEIMLQQTRVAAVLDHFDRFFRLFPSLDQLAAAPEASVLAAWSGLGYYRRARLMHAAAREVVRQHGGIFPTRATELRKLPGIGRYTAAAIASIAFNEPVAVVDGNVERVLQRVAGEKLKSEEIWRSAEALLSRKRPGDFNQAMMELGATICLPRDPKCPSCPLVELCRTRGELASGKRATKQLKKELHYALNCTSDAVFLVQRPKRASLMPAMWELPSPVPDASLSEDVWLTLKHSITVTNYTVRVLRTTDHRLCGQWIAKEALPHTPLTGLARKILVAAQLL